MSSETQPGPTADRITELKANIEHWHRVTGRFGSSTRPEREDLARYEAELSRLRNPELNERGEPMDGATIARGRRPLDSDNAPFRNEQPKGGDAVAHSECAFCKTTANKSDPRICEYVEQVATCPWADDATKERVRKFATSPGPQDVREALDELHVKFRAASNITAFTLADIEMLLNIADGRIAAKQREEAALRRYAGDDGVTDEQVEAACKAYESVTEEMRGIDPKDMRRALEAARAKSTEKGGAR